MASVFFSYSHKDEALRDQLESHLALLKNQGLIDGWHDRRIVAGDELDDAIFGKLEEADIILLLVSSDFISSPYCYSREMKRAMERHDLGETRVIPVILRHCMWHGAPFGKLKAAPRDGKPITSWPDRDEALADVAKEVAKAVEDIGARAKPALAAASTRAAPARSAEIAALKPRSSNLRLKKEFTEKDRDGFLRSTFEFVCKFFEGSVEAIGERNSEVTGTFERIDSRRMAAILYRGGKKIAECSVRQEGLTRNNGIAFSFDASANYGSFNEMLSVEADEQSLYLKSMGLAWNGSGRDKHLSQEGAAEFLWELFIKNAQ
jgi:hypothetical protein